VGRAGLVGAVTVTFNSEAVIGPFMDSMLKQDYRDFRLYVIDNASSDGTLRAIAEYRDPRMVVIANRENVGVAEGNNKGIRAALADGCDAVLLINNDTVFGPDLISGLFAALAEHECEMVVPKILFYDEPDKIWCAGGYLSWVRGSARHFGFGRKDDGRFDHAQQVNYNPTCCMLIKREVFERVGLIDANYFVYFDDTDFCLRAYRAGVRLFYVPEARLLHKVGHLTGGSESLFTIRYSTRNHVYYLLKHFPTWQAWALLLAFQGHITFKYLLLRRSTDIFFMAERAFREGLELSARRTADANSWECAAENRVPLN
jgi:GT2 family glycosyltransferase